MRLFRDEITPGYVEWEEHGAKIIKIGGLEDWRIGGLEDWSMEFFFTDRVYFEKKPIN
jgi:hypothetical protein